MKKLKKISYGSSINAVFSNAMLGTQQTPKTKKLAKRNPYGDKDRDFLVAGIDCNDYNSGQHSLWTSAKTFFKTSVSTVKNIIKKPEPPAYTINVSPTPAGRTKTTSGTTVSTPGSPSMPGLNFNITTPTKTGGGGGRTSSTGGVSVAPTTIPTEKTTPGSSAMPGSSSIVTGGQFPTLKEFPEAPAKQKAIKEAGQKLFLLGEEQRARERSNEKLAELNKEYTTPKKSWVEKNVIARTPAGSISTFGSLAKGWLRGSEYVGEKIPPLKWTAEKLQWKAPESQVVAYGSDILKNIFFTPAFTPTYTIEKNLASTNILGFRGTSEKLPETDFYQTTADFYTNFGKKGKAISRTITKPAGKNVYASFTYGTGKTYSRVVEFPTGRTWLKPTSSTKGVQFSLSRLTDNNLFYSVGKGGAVGKGGLTEFNALDLGKVSEELTSSLGKTTFEKGSPMYSFGQIKNLDAVNKNLIGDVTKVSTNWKKTPFSTTFQPQSTIQTTNIKNLIGTTNLKNIISAGLEKQAVKSTAVSNVLRSSSLWAGTGMYERTATEPVFKQKYIFKPTYNQPSASATSQIQNLLIGEKNVQANKEKSKTTQGFKFYQAEESGLAQRQTINLRQYNKQIQNLTRAFAPTLPVKVTTIPKIPFTFYYKKPEYYKVKKPTKAEKKKLKQQKKAYQSSVAAYQLGIYGKPTKRITGLEIRPMQYTKQNNYAKKIKNAFSLNFHQKRRKK